MHTIYRLTLLIVKLIRWIQYLIFRAATPLVKHLLGKIFGKAGVTLNGLKPHDILLNSDEVYARIGANIRLGLGETYIEGLWECEDFAEFAYRLIKGEVYRHPLASLDNFLNDVELMWFNNQRREKALEVGQKHYDAGNDLFEIMLGETMNYSCAYWKNATNLDDAQRDKMDLIARKLKLERGMKILDIGCGWGSMSKFLTENYGVEVVGITISKEGAEYSRQACSGLPVDIKLMDYRDLDYTLKFDRIIGIEILFHVGKKNYAEFFNILRTCLKDDGLLFLHVIGVNHKGFPLAEPFYNTIFPNCQFPYYLDLMKEIKEKFIIEDWQNIGNDFAKTGQACFDNFERGWGKLEGKYGERFYRMWEVYLKTTIGAFRARKIQLWHLVLSKNGIDGGYYAER